MSIKKEIAKLKKQKVLYGPATQKPIPLITGSIGVPTVSVAHQANKLMKTIAPTINDTSDKVFNVLAPFINDVNKSFENNTASLDEMIKNANTALIELNKIKDKEAKSYASTITSWISSVNPFVSATVVVEKKPEKKEEKIEELKPVQIAVNATAIPPSAVAINKAKPQEQIQNAIQILIANDKLVANEIAVYSPSVLEDVFEYLQSINYGERSYDVAMYISDKINQLREADKKMKDTPVTTREMNNILGINLSPLSEYDDDLITTDIAIPGSNIEPTYHRRVPLTSSINDRIINQFTKREPDFSIINRNQMNPFKLPQSSTNVYDLPAQQYENAFYDQSIYAQLNPFVGLQRQNPQDKGQSLITENRFTQ